MMHTSFQYNRYFLKRKVLALTGKFTIEGPDGQPLLYSEQRMFKLKEDIRIYNGPDKTQELLRIKARQVIDFSAAYDVFDPFTQTQIGALQRRGLRSITRDEWQILDLSEQPFGVVIEDDIAYALLRRFLLGSLLPQNYDILISGSKVADLRQKFNPFRYEMLIDFTPNQAKKLDPRLGIAAALLLGIVEGKQSS